MYEVFDIDVLSKLVLIVHSKVCTSTFGFTLNFDLFWLIRSEMKCLWQLSKQD